MRVYDKRTNRTLNKLGQFDWNDTAFENQLGAREYRPTTKLPNGDEYEGEWLIGTDIREGRGTLVVYSFNKMGPLVQSYGCQYDGYFRDNMICGKGRAIWLNGFIYEGEFDQNLRHGKGKMIW